MVNTLVYCGCPQHFKVMTGDSTSQKTDTDFNNSAGLVLKNNMYKPSKEEKETVITFDQAGGTADFYTCDEAWKHKMDKLALQGQVIIEETQDKNSKTYIIPKKWIKVRKPRLYTDEKRKEAIVRGKKLANYKKLAS